MSVPLTRPSTREDVALTGRLIPLIVTIITSLVSAILIFSRNYRNIGGFLNIVENDRASTALIVQILSSVLGLMQSYVATSLFNFATRIWVAQRSITLGKLSLWTAISTSTVNSNLPLFGSILVMLIITLFHGPGALWAGALIPLLTTVTRTEGSIQIPTYTNSSRYIWDNEFQLRGDEVWNIINCTSVDNGLGFISSCPVPDFQGSLLNSASSATTVSGALRDQSKIDNPTWSFKGRSYGVASSEGIVSPGGRFKAPLAYTYTQMGYDVTVSCSKNSSAGFNIQFITSDEFYFTTWEIQGYLPNSVPGNPENYPSTTWYSTSNGTAGGPPVLGWAAVVNPEADERNMIGIAAGGQYTSLNQTQCSVVFKPQGFDIFVNMTEQSISVTPSPNITDIVDPEPTGSLMNNAMWSLNLLSRMSPSLYVSVLGNTLQNNVNNVLAAQDANMTEEEIEDATLGAISDSFTTILDSILVSFGSAQLALAYSNTTTTVASTLPALQIGQDRYIFATAGINAILLLSIIIEAARTKLWHKLPLFNYTNIETMLVAASARGKSIALDVHDKHTTLKTY
jgi:hypothetical protein